MVFRQGLEAKIPFCTGGKEHIKMTVFGGLELVFLMQYWGYLGIIVPTDFHILQRGRVPPTRTSLSEKDLN